MDEDTCLTFLLLQKQSTAGTTTVTFSIIACRHGWRSEFETAGVKENARHKFVSLAVYIACIRPRQSVV